MTKLTAKEQYIIAFLRKNQRVSFMRIYYSLPDHFTHGGRPALKRCMQELVKKTDLKIIHGTNLTQVNFSEYYLVQPIIKA